MAEKFLNGIKADTITETTTNAGVTIEGVLIKDGQVIGSSSVGVKNYILNPSSQGGSVANWTADNFTVTSDSSTNIPRETTTKSAFKLVSSGASNLATFISSVMQLDDSDLSRKLGIELAINSGVSGWTIDVENCATSGGTFVRIPLSTDSSGSTVLPATTGVFKASVDMDSSKPFIRFVISCPAAINTVARTSYFSDIIVTPDSRTVTGAVIQGPFTYTPTLTGFGTPTAVNFSYSRVGPKLFVEGRFTTGTTTAVEAKLSLPSGLTTTTPGNVTLIRGEWKRSGSGAITVKTGVIQITGLLQHVTFGLDDYTNGVNPLTSYNGATLTDSGQTILVYFECDIAEWAGSGTVNVAGNDVEYAYNSSTSTSSDTTSFAYGPSGALIQSFAPSGTTGVVKRVRFQTPIQDSDRLIVEIWQNEAGVWTSAGDWLSSYTRNDAGTTAYGIYVANVTGSKTDLDVHFYSAISPGIAWSSFTSYKWRVRKVSATSVAGFALADSVSAGLMGTGTQTLAGAKTFNNQMTVADAIYTTKSGQPYNYLRDTSRSANNQIWGTSVTGDVSHNYWFLDAINDNLTVKLNVMKFREDGICYIPKINTNIGSFVAVHVAGGGELTAVSSVRASKTNITSITDASWIYDLIPRTFNYRKQDADGNFTDEPQLETKFGFIADEVEAINPTAVTHDAEGNMLAVDYASYVAPIVKILQEQKAIIEALEARIAALENN